MEWQALGKGVDGPVQALASSSRGLYVGGAFSNAGSTSAPNVARWTGSGWRALGDQLPQGVNGPISALASTEDRLSAGGSFSLAANLLSSQFAEFDILTYEVSPSATGTGIITPDTLIVVESGEELEFTLIPDSGSSLIEVTGSCSGTLDELVFTTDPVLADCSVEALFMVVDRIFSDRYELAP